MRGADRRGRVAAAGHDDAVGLVVVTKFFPASDVRLLADLGVREVGENRHQEAEAKAAECADLDLVWHYIGGLQSNKAAAVARYADVVESLDRLKLVRGLDRGAAERGSPLDVLVQVSLDPPGAEHRAGAEPDDVPALAEAVEASRAPAPARADGRRARWARTPRRPSPAWPQVRERLLADHPHADRLSAGMSGDLEQAVAAGATHVRVGSAILGSRPAVR